MSIKVTYNDLEIRTALDGLLSKMNDLTPALRDMGEELMLSTKQRFAKSESPDGDAWAPNSPVTLARKKGTSPLIGESRRLRNEISYSVKNGELLIGSPMVYAAVQHFGASRGQFGKNKRNSPIPWGNIPARPFLGLSDTDKENVLDIIQEHLGL